MTEFAEGYRGARFYKCDLQMQTPEDASHWMDDSIRLSAPRNPDDLRRKARLYLKCCYEVGLEVIGITDHNFSNLDEEGDWFLFYLIEQNEQVARELGCPPLVIFPGFEIDIGYHVLCLFEPGTPLRNVSHCLTRLGLPPGRRRVNGQNQQCRHPDGSLVAFADVLQLIQEQCGGLVIMAHAISDNGVANKQYGSNYAADFRNDKLLVIEVDSVPLQGRAKTIVEAREGVWERRRPVGFILSSDAKRLRPVQGGDTNYIGWRHTWIKMSRPSISALKQAFLDQAHQIKNGRPNEESRVRFGDASPDEGYGHSRIRSIRVQGAAFLSDRTIIFSPNLNTLIGGRGTGKSTLIEYLRLALGRAEEVHGEEARRNIEKIWKTVERQTVIEVDFDKEGQTWHLQTVGGRVPVVEGAGEIDITRFFPVRLFSQREIYALAESREARSKLLDNLIEDKLSELKREQEDLIREIRNLSGELMNGPELEKRRRALETERKDYQARVARLQQLQEPLRRWKGLLAEEEFLKDLRQESHQLASRLRETVEGLELTGTALGSMLSEGPNAGLIQQLAERADVLVGRLREAVASAVDEFEKGIAAALNSPELQEWGERFKTALEEYENLRNTLLSQGTDPDQYLSYENLVRAREVELREVDKRLAALEEIRQSRDKKIDRLRGLWQQETDLRLRAAERLMEAVPKIPTGKPFVTVKVDAFGDDRAFAERMQDLIRDWRRISRDDWGAFSERDGRILPEDSFLAAVVNATPSGVSPVDTFLQWLADLKEGRQPDGCPWGADDRRTNTVLEWWSEKEQGDISLWRPPDRVRVELFRQDGSRAGELEEGLSVGQRCTAILALLLAQDQAPVVIDQPEDDLDNEFIFNELVPLLRHVKEKRQIIIATHNANIPVNADAELIIALEAREGRGIVKRLNGEESLGALDAPEVCVAVEEIMEGSEEAFRRRYEKYGF